MLIGGYWMLPDSKPDPEVVKAKREARVNVDKPRSAAIEVPKVEGVPQRRKVKQVWNKENKSWEREIVDATPEEEAERAAKDEYGYKLSRLRLSASDAAAPCWKGGDVPDEIHIAYSVVVAHDMLQGDNVRVLENHVTDQATVACIVQSIEDMRAPSDGLPEARHDYDLTMSMHDLFVRNRGYATQQEDRDTKVDPGSTPIDRPPATWPPPKP